MKTYKPVNKLHFDEKLDPSIEEFLNTYGEDLNVEVRPSTLKSSRIGLGHLPTKSERPYTVEIGSFETNDFWFEHFATLAEAEGCVEFWDGRDGLEAWICGRPEPTAEEKFAREFGYCAPDQSFEDWLRAQREFEYEQREREKLRAEAEAKLAKNDYVLCWAWYWHYIGEENVVFAVAHTVDEVLKAYDRCQTLEDYSWDGLE